jgi:VanZ family protein
MAFPAAMFARAVSIRLWIPVLLWMLLIFIGSTDVLSSRHTSRFIGPVLRWIWPAVSEATIERVQYAVRKGGHLSEYAVLALLVRRALHRDPSFLAPWSLARSAGALAIAATYAAGDEFHQSFVSTRYASGWDVLIDTAGAAVGLGLVWLVVRRRGRSPNAQGGNGRPTPASGTDRWRRA